MRRLLRSLRLRVAASVTRYGDGGKCRSGALLGGRVLLSHEPGSRSSDLELTELTVSREVEHDHCKLNARGLNFAGIIAEMACD